MPHAEDMGLLMPDDDARTQAENDAIRRLRQLNEGLAELRRIEEIKLERERLRTERALAKLRTNGVVHAPLELVKAESEKESTQEKPIDPVEYRHWVLEWQRGEQAAKDAGLKPIKETVALMLGFHPRTIPRQMRQHGHDPNVRSDWPPSRWDPDTPPEKPVA